MPWSKDNDNPAYHQAAWRRARAKALKDARGRCEVHYTGCQGAASQVDHIDGIANDPNHTNLRAVCVSCHGKITSKQGNDAQRGRTKDPEPTPRTEW